MLPSLTLAFIAGLALGSGFPYFPISISILLGSAAFGMTVFDAVRVEHAWRSTAVFCALLLGILYWFLTVEAVSRPVFDQQGPEQYQSYSGRIIAPVQLSPDRMVMVVRLEPGVEQPKGSPVVRLTWRVADRMLLQGDRLAFRARLRAPSGSLNPGGFNYGAYLERQGIDATATVSGTEAVEFLESGSLSLHWRWWNHIDRWRAAIRLAAVRSLTQPALGLYLGIIIGERGYLDQDLRDQFMVSGTVHLLSISGSHLGLVAILTFILVRRGLLWLPAPWLLALSRRITPTRLAAVCTLVPVSAYACLAGAELATMRSLVMILVALIAKWLGYEQRIFHALAAAAMAIVLHDPQAIYDISFQLSFLSVCAVSWWLTRSALAHDDQLTVSGSRLAGIMRWGQNALTVSAVITITTVPLVAFYFNQLPWLGLVANLAAVPVMGGLLVPLGLIAVLAERVLGAATLPLAGLIQWSIDWFVTVLHAVSAIPGGEWHVASPSLPTMLLFYACVGATWLGAGRRAITWPATGGMMLLLAWWIWSPRMLLDGDRFRITFLDVSQGDSAVLELPDGKVVLIDGGAAYERFDMGRGVVAPYLWNRGIRAIDHMIGTHPQLDHVGGLAYVLRHFSVQHFWGTGDGRDEPFYHRVQDALASQGLREEIAGREGNVLAAGDCRLQFLNPSNETGFEHVTAAGRSHGQALNNRSIVIHMTCGRHTMLFTADVEQEALTRLTRDQRVGRVNLVKVPHHGAASSLQREWLLKVHPGHAVISVGRHNPYGHPAGSVLEAYAAQGVLLYRTDRDGAVWVTGRRSDPTLEVHRAIDQRLQRVVTGHCLWGCEQSNWARLLGQWEE